MAETLYLIDGYAAIFRAFFAIRHPLHSPVTGEPTHGVLVFAQMLLKLLSRLRPDYLVVVLDAPGKTFRDDLYAQYPSLRAGGSSSSGGEAAEDLSAVVAPAPGGETTAGPPGPAAEIERYKGNRPAMPDALEPQIARILELLALFGIPVVAKPGLEADDLIATLTDRVLEDPARPDVHIRIVSRDKDLEQLLGDRVTLFDVHTETTVDVAALRERKGITPAQVVDVLALAGDPVDNIPGVPGVGPKTAARLLQQFGSLDGVLANLDRVTGEQRRRNLESARAYLPLSRTLATLRRDPETEFCLDAARVPPASRLPLPEILQWCERMGFTRLQQEVRKLIEPGPEEVAP